MPHDLKPHRSMFGRFGGRLEMLIADANALQLDTGYSLPLRSLISNLELALGSAQDAVVEIDDFKPALTDAEITNLRTACMTSSMRTEPGWAAALDALATKLDSMRED